MSLLLLLALVLSAPAALAQPDTLYVVLPDTTDGPVQRVAGGWIYDLDGLTIEADVLRLTETEADLSRTALLDALDRGGLDLVRRGDALVSDVRLDGFGGSDVEVVIDGERYPSSCPSRMDPPVSRVNPLEVDVVRVDRSATTAQARLGGAVAFRRAPLPEATRVRLGLAQTALDDLDGEASLAIEGRRHRLTGRLVRNRSYLDGDGASFGDRYGYTSDHVRATLADASVQGARGAWTYGATAALTRDLPLPYLQMDERENTLWGAFADWNGHKLYLNHTRHLMDNGLRQQSSRMTMETDAVHLTAGLTGRVGPAGPSYDAYLRRWDGWNTMAMLPMEGDGTGMGGDTGGGADMPMMPMRQHIVPELWLTSAAVAHEVQRGPFTVGGKLGVTRTAIGDEDRLAFFQTLYAEAETARWYVPAGVSVDYAAPLSTSVLLGLSAEVATDAPAPERLYIGVRRMMGRPSWIGNPTLDAPVKGAFRATLDTPRLRVTTHAQVVGGYVALAAADAPAMDGAGMNGVAMDGAGMDGMEATPSVTYANVDAFLMGFDARATWTYVALSASYTWAEDLDSGEALAEMPPLRAAATLTSPRWHGLSASFTTEAAARQTRVATTVGETETPAWVRLDAGLTYSASGVTLAVEATNLTDALFFQHLAYRRDPFSAGQPVYEPGRMLRLRLLVTR